VDIPLPMSDAVLVVQASIRQRKEEEQHEHERYTAAARPAANEREVTKKLFENSEIFQDKSEKSKCFSNTLI
jgi:hypothetical protein